MYSDNLFTESSDGKKHSKDRYDREANLWELDKGLEQKFSLDSHKTMEEKEWKSGEFLLPILSYSAHRNNIKPIYYFIPQLIHHSAHSLLVLNFTGILKSLRTFKTSFNRYD